MNSVRDDRPRKFILFPLGFLLAHVGRLMELGKELRARGHEVIFAGADPAHPRTKMGMPITAGFRTITALEPEYRYAWDRFERYGWPVTAWDLLNIHKWAPLDKILDGQVDLIRSEQPDMVIGDGTISVSTAAHICGIPAAGVMNAYNARFLSPTSVFSPLIRGWNALHLAALRNRVYRKHGIEQVNALELLRAIPLISPDLPGLYPEPRGWKHWHTVGPIVTDVDCPLPDWYDEISDGTPNIYITMGSTGLLDRFLRRTYEPFSKLPCRFLVTTSDQVSAQTAARAPRNFRLACHAPGSKLLEHCDAMIFHGGNGTMYQALACGVPMIALPSHLEQRLCFQPALRHGFGKIFHPRRFNIRRLLRALEEVRTNPTYRTAARQFAAPVRETNGRKTAADILEAAARLGKPAGIAE